MSSDRRLSGQEAEDWFKEFAIKTEIISRLDSNLQVVVELFSTQLSQRLDLAMTNVYAELPEAPGWLELVLARRSPGITEQQTQEFIDYLLDRVLATDEIIAVKNNQGQTVTIAVDVTTNAVEERKKLNKVRGLPESTQRDQGDRNKNIPSVRRRLGIDKHLILVINNEAEKLPSYDKLLREIADFTNEVSNTKALNLSDVPVNERFTENTLKDPNPQALWKRFSQGLPRRTGLETSTQVCILAIRAGVNQANVFRMLECDPQCRQLSADQARSYSRLIYDRANERIELQRMKSLSQREINRRGLNAARFIVAHVGKNQANGDRVAKGGNLVTMTQRGDDFKIERSDERGVILNLKDKRLSGTLSIRDLQTFEELAGQFQAAAQKEAAAQKDNDLER